MKWEMATARRYRASYAWNREEWTCAGRVGQLVPSAVRRGTGRGMIPPDRRSSHRRSGGCRPGRAAYSVPVQAADRNGDDAQGHLAVHEDEL